MFWLRLLNCSPRFGPGKNPREPKPQEKSQLPCENSLPTDEAVELLQVLLMINRDTIQEGLKRGFTDAQVEQELALTRELIKLLEESVKIEAFHY